jgi:hypothetical protein
MMSYPNPYKKMFELKINIPVALDLTYWLSRLKYLETAVAKSSMTEVARRAEVKEATDKFREAIIMRDSEGFDPLYA